MTGRPWLIVQLGAPMPAVAARWGEFAAWISAGLDLAPEQVRVVNVPAGDALPPPTAARAIVLTGSPAMVTERRPWSERTAAWLPGAVASGVPLLGICYGHQLLAQALGGEVGYNPRGREFGTCEVALLPAAQADPLFAGLASPLAVQECHAQSVLRLPPGARLLAANAHDPHQAFALGAAAWGVQFHPEFSADIMRSYVLACQDRLAAAGLAVAALHAGVRETASGATLFARFRALADRSEPPAPPP